MKKLLILCCTLACIGGGITVASEVNGDLNSSDLSNGLQVGLACSPASVSNGTVNSFTCQITCNGGYNLQGNQCVAPSSGPSGGGGGGGGGGGSASCPTTTLAHATVNPSTCQVVCSAGYSLINFQCISDAVSGITTGSGSNSNPPVNSSTNTTTTHSCDSTNGSYDDEQRGAYSFACKASITTRSSIEDSLFTGYLFRRDMAKMISNFAINIMGKKPDLTKPCIFSDVAEQDAEMKGYIKTSCQLGYMGYKGDGTMQSETFNPDANVTRAQFATIISRFLWGNKYDIDPNSPTWYSYHLQALKDAGIITVTDPDMLEQRGFAWIIFTRLTAKYGN